MLPSYKEQSAGRARGRGGLAPSTWWPYKLCTCALGHDLAAKAGVDGGGERHRVALRVHRRQVAGAVVMKPRDRPLAPVRRGVRARAVVADFVPAQAAARVCTCGGILGGMTPAYLEDEPNGWTNTGALSAGTSTKATPKRLSAFGSMHLCQIDAALWVWETCHDKSCCLMLPASGFSKRTSAPLRTRARPCPPGSAACLGCRIPRQARRSRRTRPGPPGWSAWQRRSSWPARKQSLKRTQVLHMMSHIHSMSCGHIVVCPSQPERCSHVFLFGFLQQFETGEVGEQPTSTSRCVLDQPANASGTCAWELRGADPAVPAGST